MKNYVGRKIRGFMFEDWINGVVWNEKMEAYIGRVGEVLRQRCDNCVVVEFDDDDTWSYPISLIEPHLIDEESPEIPQLEKGVLMQVSDCGKSWIKTKIIAQLYNGQYLGGNCVTWNYARPIPQLPKYTHAELVEKLGHDFEIIK
jgi:hypothetical protein